MFVTLLFRVPGQDLVTRQGVTGDVVGGIFKVAKLNRLNKLLLNQLMLKDISVMVEWPMGQSWEVCCDSEDIF